MPITITCACGRQIRAADEHVGRRVKCPGCEALNLVPAPPAPPKADLIRFPCSCGKIIQAKAEHAGKMTRCPVCGEKARIPGATAPSNGSSPANPKIKAKPDVPPVLKQPPRKAAKVEEVEEVEEVQEAEEAEEVEEVQEARAEEDVEVVEENRPKKRKKRKVGGTWTLLIVLGGAGLFLLCGGCLTGVGLYFYMRTPDDLKYVPDDAQKMGSVRLADILALDKDKTISNMLAPGSTDAELGMEPTEVERLTMVVTRDNKTWNIILSVSSVDQKKVLAKMFKDPTKEVKFKDQVIIVQDVKGLTDPRGVCFVSGRILLVGQRSAIEAALDKYPRQKTEGVIANGVKLASSGYHLAEAQNNTAFGGELPFGMEGTAKGIKITGNRFEVKSIATYTSADKAKAIMDMGKELGDKMKGAFPTTAARNDLDISTTQSGREIITITRGDRDSKGGFKSGFPGFFNGP